jgi:Rrf2 family transcriptional regulator, nitric oxide-sensitive transcriptional repressor
VLGKTTIAALRALFFLLDHEPGTCLSPRRIAEALGESPTYLAKVLRHLVRAGVLRAERGARGGVRLDVPPGQVTLLQVVQACHGTIVPSHCQAAADGRCVCGFHMAALELHEATRGVLSRWTLSDLHSVPVRLESIPDEVPCLITGSRGF